MSFDFTDFTPAAWLMTRAALVLLSQAGWASLDEKAAVQALISLFYLNRYAGKMHHALVGDKRLRFVK